MDSFHVAEDKDSCRAVVNAAVSIRVPYKA
jgi:hypothetical protein